MEAKRVLPIPSKRQASSEDLRFKAPITWYNLSPCKSQPSRWGAQASLPCLRTRLVWLGWSYCACSQHSHKHTSFTFWLTVLVETFSPAAVFPLLQRDWDRAEHNWNWDSAVVHSPWCSRSLQHLSALHAGQQTRPRPVGGKARSVESRRPALEEGKWESATCGTDNPSEELLVEQHQVTFF